MAKQGFLRWVDDSFACARAACGARLYQPGAEREGQHDAGPQVPQHGRQPPAPHRCAVSGGSGGGARHPAQASITQPSEPGLRRAVPVVVRWVMGSQGEGGLDESGFWGVSPMAGFYC
mmetsp:Transcript_6876/g.16905  ORF Transcript_6876/g.16905 Transcript_6876/m.16905 type:complete len:118 (+) Transcript_6876:1184-1537(+)